MANIYTNTNIYITLENNKDVKLIVRHTLVLIRLVHSTILRFLIIQTIYTYFFKKELFLEIQNAF